MDATMTVQAQSDMQALVGDIKQLPTPPMVFTQINRMMANPNASLYDVARILAEDPGMSARVLKMANSAFYALPQPVTSVRQAIVILGLEAVRSIVLSASVIQTFSGYESDPEYQDHFWRHSLATASAARVLAGRVSNRDVQEAEESFSAGLLHDIGKIILASHMPELRARVLAHPKYRVVEDRFVEIDALGYSHADVGGHLAECWNLPDSLRAAIVHHHDLQSEDEDLNRLTQIIHLADYLAHWIDDLSADRKKLLPLIDWDVAAEFDLSDETLPDVGALVRTEFGRSETFLEMARV